MRNQFTPLHPLERKKMEEKKQRAREARLDAIEAARECINTEKFKKYKDKLKYAEQATIDQIIELRMTDPVEYAFEMQRITNNLRSIRTLLIEVEKDAGSSEKSK